MRAVAENKQVAALMGIDVDSVISRTFIISGALAGAAGVMWGIHLGLVYFYVGFIPGIKAFTAAVLGGIGSVPGAMLGGVFLGVVEALGPGVCHEGYRSCFFRTLREGEWAVTEDRTYDPDAVYGGTK